MGPAEWIRSVAPTKRWYADKSRAVADVAIAWRAPLPGTIDLQLVVAAIAFTDGTISFYFLPWDPSSENDAIASAEFTSWLIDSIAGRSEMPAGLTWHRVDEADLSSVPSGSGRLLGAEQSNTSIRYGSDVMIKVNRRLTAGQSPEAELSAVIAKAADGSFAAQVHGLLMLSGPTDEPTCVATCSRYIANVGDAWSFMLGHLSDPFDVKGEIGNEVEAIGAVTAAMHVGLTSDPWRREVAPEAITRIDIDRWHSATRGALLSLLNDLEARELTLPADSMRLAQLLPNARPMLEEQLGGYQALLGTYRIRIHGDYHLGQLLRKPGGGYVVVDFDGEPNRSLAERRDKYSALRDVAGMLRSFAYARGTAERAAGPDAHAADWRAWERTARDQFLNAYRVRIGTPAVPLIPESAEDTRQAVATFELEKAIYECGYELSNRPDWLWLPLSRLVSSG